MSFLGSNDSIRLMHENVIIKRHQSFAEKQYVDL